MCSRNDSSFLLDLKPQTLTLSLDPKFQGLAFKKKEGKKKEKVVRPNPRMNAGRQGGITSVGRFLR